jgi:hypothetical protein
VSNTDTTNDSELRRESRVPINLRAVVKGKLNKTEIWKESTEITSLSRMGSGFCLPHPCSTGHLITLEIPMPDEFRAYDLNRKTYSIVALIQHCNERLVDGETVYDIGVAFIGKNPPESYKENPEQSYRISGITDEGLWQIHEAQKPFKSRRHARYRVKVPITVSLIQKSRELFINTRGKKEYTVTTEISQSGLSFLSSLEVDVGDKVKLACEEYDFYSIAIVRNRNEILSRLPSVHLEFVDARFPIEKIAMTVAPIIEKGIEEKVEADDTTQR